jgi:hypothetical protein
MDSVLALPRWHADDGPGDGPAGSRPPTTPTAPPAETPSPLTGEAGSTARPRTDRKVATEPRTLDSEAGP